MRSIRLLPDCIPFSAIGLAVLLFSLVLSAQGQNASPQPPGTLVDVGGYHVHLYCVGHGSPTVFIVGAAFSFDWGLVQPEVAKCTKVCTFDPSGTAWSDPFTPAATASSAASLTPTCEDRVDEIHRLVTKAPIDGPYILVGFSVGALWERLYAFEHPDNIVGMVIVDHAFLPDAGKSHPHQNPTNSKPGYSPPVLISQAPIVIGFEDDSNFRKLPKRDQEFHTWALSQHPLRPGYQMTVDCFSRIKTMAEKRPYPLGNMPLVVISTPNDASGYADLQTNLLGLSRSSKQVIAWNSSHMVPIDEPQIIVDAIHRVVEDNRKHGN